MSIQSTYRRKAKQLGIPFSVLLDVYREQRMLQRQEREREWSMRRDAWEGQTPKGCHGFWRHGWQVRYPRAFGEGDRTNIPGFDDLAQAIACEYPELNREDDPAEALFEFLSQPHNCLPSAEETWDEAIESWAENAGDCSLLNDSAIPF